MIGAHHPDRIGQTPQEAGRQIGPKQKRLNHVRPFLLHEFPQAKQDPKVKFSGSVEADHPYAPPAKLLHQASAALQGADRHIELRAVDARRELEHMRFGSSDSQPHCQQHDLSSHGGARRRTAHAQEDRVVPVQIGAHLSVDIEAVLHHLLCFACHQQANAFSLEQPDDSLGHAFGVAGRNEESRSPVVICSGIPSIAVATTGQSARGGFNHGIGKRIGLRGVHVDVRRLIVPCHE